MSVTSQIKTDCKDDIGYVAQLKQQKSITCQHTDYMGMCC